MNFCIFFELQNEHEMQVRKMITLDITGVSNCTEFKPITDWVFVFIGNLIGNHL